MFYTKEKFQEDIKQLVRLHNVSYLDAIVMFCGEKGIEVEDTLPLITPYIKNKLHIDGMDCGLLKKEPTVTELFK